MGTGETQKQAAERHRRSHQHLVASYFALKYSVSHLALSIDQEARNMLAKHRADKAEKAVA